MLVQSIENRKRQFLPYPVVIWAFNFHRHLTSFLCQSMLVRCIKEEKKRAARINKNIVQFFVAKLVQKLTQIKQIFKSHLVTYIFKKNYVGCKQISCELPCIYCKIYAYNLYVLCSYSECHYWAFVNMFFCFFYCCHY